MQGGLLIFMPLLLPMSLSDSRAGYESHSIFNPTLSGRTIAVSTIFITAFTKNI